jgi:hypothetical protein
MVEETEMGMEMTWLNGVLQYGVKVHGTHDYQSKISVFKKGEINGREKDVSYH